MIKSYALAENKFNKFAYFNRIYQSVAHFTMRTYGENQTFRFVEGIWLQRKSRQIRFFVGKVLIYFIRAQHVLSYHLI